MKAIIDLKVSENFDIDGKIIYKNLTKGIDQYYCNTGYSLSCENGKIIMVQKINNITKYVSIEHDQNLTIYFKGVLNVPLKTSQTKTDNYLEANIESAVIPLLTNLTKNDYEIFLYLPENFRAVGFSKKGHYYYRYLVKSFDVALIIYHKDIVYQYSLDSVNIFSNKYHSREKIKQMAEIANDIYDKYTKMFSPCAFDRVNIILNPRFDNGAYVRDNLVCLVDQIEGLNQQTFLHLAHEIAHLWWQNSNLLFNNLWIDETFAQYSALLLVKEKFESLVYQQIINQFQIKTATMDSLASIQSNVTDRFAIHYYKGPYLFHELAKTIGEHQMIELMKKSYQEKISTSEQFLKLCPEFKQLYHS